MNFWEMSQKLNITTIPDFTKGKFMVVRLAHPKGKTIRDGMVATTIMTSYEGENGSIELVKIQEGPGGYGVTFPKGKRGLLATKFRGPKSWYRFYNNVEDKFYQWGQNDPKTGVNSNLTLPYVREHLSNKVPNWEGLSVTEQDHHVDAYYEQAYFDGLAKDFNLDIEVNPGLKPEVGMVTEMYRRYTPPKEDERYGNVVVTKFAPREGKPPLSGDYTMVDAEIAASVYDALVRKEDTSFNPKDFKENSDEDSDDELDMAA